VFLWMRRHLKFLGVPNGDGFVVISGGNDRRSRKNDWYWRRDWNEFAKQEGEEGLDSFHFIRRCFLDACNSGGKSRCCVNDSQEGMIFELEHVCDPCTSCVGH
jgi:hypothetical protein